VFGQPFQFKTRSQSNLTKKATSPPHMDSSVAFTRWRQCAPPLNTCFCGPTRVHSPNGIWSGSAVFAHLTAEGPILCNGRPFSPQNCPFTWGSGPPSNTWFLGLTRVNVSNVISIGSTLFAGLTIVTDGPDRQTDHATRL